MNIYGYNRIIIVGNNGSGKSFLSKELSAITNLPLVHLDVEFWLPNWEKPGDEEWIEIQKKLISKEKWIIEGNHTSTMELRFRVTDLVIFLDVNRFVCLTSIIRRNGKSRTDMPEYLEEKFDVGFFRLLKETWRFTKTRKRIIMRLHEKFPNKPFIIIDSRRKMNKLLDQWKQENNKY